MEKKVFIEGMSCQNCVRHVREALMDVKGVTEVVDVNLVGGFAIINGDFKDEKVKATLEEEGYKVSRIKDIE
jgi:copper chaperone CopZ